MLLLVIMIERFPVDTNIDPVYRLGRGFVAARHIQGSALTSACENIYSMHGTGRDYVEVHGASNGPILTMQYLGRRDLGEDSSLTTAQKEGINLGDVYDAIEENDDTLMQPRPIIFETAQIASTNQLGEQLITILPSINDLVVFKDQRDKMLDAISRGLGQRPGTRTVSRPLAIEVARVQPSLGSNISANILASLQNMLPLSGDLGRIAFHPDPRNTDGPHHLI